MQKLIIKTFTIILFVFILMNISSISAEAATTLRLHPSVGYVEKGSEFIVDILIDTEGAQVIKTRTVVTFDPTRVEIVKAERNNTLFASFDANEQSTDNTNGVLMLNGFTQSGAAPLYATDGEADVFGRITFRALKDGPVTFDWEYTGSDEPFKTVVMADGSPPQNVLTGKPGAITYTVYSGTPGKDSGDTGTIPDTGILGVETRNIWFGGSALLGSILVLAGFNIVYKSGYTLLGRKQRTIVDFGE